MDAHDSLWRHLGNVFCGARTKLVDPILPSTPVVGEKRQTHADSKSTGIVLARISLVSDTKSK